MNGKNRHKRVCKTPYHKWTESEEKKLLCFLKNNRPIEKPFGQAYYRRFIQESNIKCEWNLVRSKVKNMRQVYYKIKAMQNTMVFGSEDKAYQKEYILKKCPMFDSYDEVFGNEDETFPVVAEDTLSWSTPSSITANYDKNSDTILCNENGFNDIFIKEEISYINDEEKEYHSVRTESGPIRNSSEKEDYSERDADDSPTLKRKRLQIETIPQKQSKILDNINPTISDDEFYYFGLSVASQLKKMPLEIALQVQAKIQFLLSKERCEILKK